MRELRVSAILALAAFLGGCTVGPDYQTPDTPTPAAFAPAVPSAAQAAAPAPAIDYTIWWQSLGDPKLDDLVKRAIATNPQLEIALARLQQARTTEAVISGGALPVADVAGGAGRGTGSNSVRGRVPPPLNAATNTAGLKEITHVVGFDAGWELDLFGRYRRAIEAAHYDREAAAEARNAVLLTLISDVARAYIDLRGLQVRLAVAQRNVETAQQTVDVVRTRFNRGLTNEFDLVLAQRQLATFQALIPPLMAGIAADIHRIAVLLGQYPEELTAELSPPGAIPAPPQQVQPGLPVELLRRRPDIREAERELAAATARIGVATADLFPRLWVTGAAGLQGQGLGRTPVSNTGIWSIGLAAYWPLLDFGTLDALIEVQEYQTHELLVSYKLTILSAVEEVDDAIAAYSADQEQLRSLSDALLTSRRAVALATERYDRGLTDFLNVLDAERQEYQLEDQYAAAQEATTLQFVALYKGLGGGWEGYQTIPPIRQPQPAIIATFRKPGSADAEPGK